MSKKSVFCIATSREQADRIVSHLKSVSFSSNDVSVLFPNNGTTGDFAHETHAKAREGAAVVAPTADIVGGPLKWIAGIGPLAIPGAGPFIAAGPIMAALSGPAVGVAVLGIADGLIVLGIPQLEARRYEGKVKAGDFLMSVHTDDPGDIARAKDIFNQAGAQDIYTTGERSTAKDTNAELALACKRV